MRADTVEKLLDISRDGMVKSSKGTLVQERKIKVNGHIGRAFSFRGKPADAEWQVQVWFVGDRQFTVFAFNTSGSLNPTDVQRFFASIRPLGKPAAGQRQERR